jgi:hypothetical protein
MHDVVRAFSSDLSSSVIPRERIEDLQRALAQVPQDTGNGESNMETQHAFAGGMYCRRFFIPAGMLIVSKVHKTEHLFIGCSGRLVVVGQGERFVLTSGGVVPSPVGTKRVVFSETDCVVMTVHKTDVTNVADLEAEIMEPDPLSLFDVNNQPKTGTLVRERQPQLKEQA